LNIVIFAIVVTSLLMIVGMAEVKREPAINMSPRWGYVGSLAH
jgi:hypothetical protein